MARIGKIARLPGGIRSQLNSRLQEGGEGKQITQWLNSLPEVKAVLAERFDRRPISEQNLSDWRQGGFEEWLAYQDLLAQAAELAANRRELEAAAPGQSPADLLADAVSFRYAAILAGQGPELDEKSLLQLRALDRVCQTVVYLRRSDQNAARLNTGGGPLGPFVPSFPCRARRRGRRPSHPDSESGRVVPGVVPFRTFVLRRGGGL